MRIVITGTSGFIGSRLLQAARAAYGADVTACTSQPSEGSHIVYSSLGSFALKPAHLALVEEAEVLIHAGAFIPKQSTDANQVAGCNSNITFVEQLLSLPWRKLRKIIFVSTVDVYAPVEGVISETSVTNPPSLYGLSKLYCERLVHIFAAKHGISGHALRVGHVYGPGEEKYRKVIPKSIQSIIEGKEIELWGDGAELRSFIYVDDVVRAVVRAVVSPDLPEIVNVAGGTPISIRAVLDMLVGIGGRGTRIVQHRSAGAARNLVFDNTLLKRHLLPEEVELVAGLTAEFRYVESLRAKNS